MLLIVFNLEVDIGFNITQSNCFDLGMFFVVFRKLICDVIHFVMLCVVNKEIHDAE